MPVSVMTTAFCENGKSSEAKEKKNQFKSVISV